MWVVKVSLTPSPVKIKNLKDLNREDRQAVISYMLDNKKRFLGELELKQYKGTYYLAVADDLFGE